VLLRRLRARGWRNLAPLDLAPGPRATVLFGHNGQGKTNVVEAAYFLATFRSFRASHNQDLVHWGEPAALVEGEVAVGGLERRIEVKLNGGRRVARLDGKAVRRDARGLQGVAAVLFVPEDLLLPRAAPAERRRFLDRAIFNANRSYSADAVAFDKVLKSRNAVLREPSPRPALLDTYDDELARLGAILVARRRGLAAAIEPRVAALFRDIHAAIDLRVRYRSHATVEAAGDAASIRAALHEGLAARRDRDQRRGFTGFGPHTDDLELELGGHLARDHGSQGQLRSLVLALKLAELSLLAEALGEPPLLLLDDVASELDQVRRGKLFETIAALPGQTILTVTDRDLLPALPQRCDFEVRAGAVAQRGFPLHNNE
jgi:DNA replication and repair protein RecF